MLSIIVAIAKNNVIGKDNKLIWHLPEDLKRFKKLTTNHTIIMGRKTFESLGRVLPNRKHVVLSHNENYIVDNKNVEVINCIDDIRKYIDSEEENFVIGGAGIYNLLLPFSKKLYITKINEEFDGDAYFPKINENEFEIVSIENGKRDEKNDYDYQYIDYIRKNV
jgi:dihydrofolate reductase